MKFLSIHLFTLLIIFSACNKKNINSSKSLYDVYPIIRYDTINEFNVGDTFVFLTSHNSCCTGCGYYHNQLLDSIYYKGFFEKISEKYLDSDGADGSSSYTQTLYKCIKKGIDTIYYAYIPNGMIEDFSLNCSEGLIDSASLYPENGQLPDFVNAYIISVK